MTVSTLNKTLSGVTLMAAGTLLSATVGAHAGLVETSATAGAQARIALAIPHGCDGAATDEVRVRLPEGVVAVNPMPKPGWELEMVHESLDTPYMDHGTEVTERVAELRWHGGALADAHYDEFIFTARMPDNGEDTLYFPTVQSCGDATLRWIEVPRDGSAEPSGDYPAPQLNLEAGASDDHHHHH